MGRYYENLAQGCTRRWTKLAFECFKRKCSCTNCDLIPEDFIKDCQVKSCVIGLIRKFGTPDKNTNIESEEL